MWSFTVGQDFTLETSLLGAVKLTENADPDNYRYSGYSTRCDASGSFLLFDGNGFVKNVLIFGIDMSSSVHIDNMKGYLDSW